ncbi:hypothetical protein ACFQ9Y_23845 [Peribacillus simplex]|uniref:hypothetical protein n=1 Tax=Peribacillus simplex TaxID=1478 RepID=UPI00366D1F4F
MVKKITPQFFEKRIVAVLFEMFGVAKIDFIRGIQRLEVIGMALSEAVGLKLVS